MYIVLYMCVCVCVCARARVCTRGIGQLIKRNSAGWERRACWLMRIWTSRRYNRVCSFSYEREVCGRERGEGRGRLLRMTEGYIYRGESYRGNVDVKDPYFFRFLVEGAYKDGSCSIFVSLLWHVCYYMYIHIYTFLFFICFVILVHESVQRVNCSLSIYKWTSWFIVEGGMSWYFSFRDFSAYGMIIITKWVITFRRFINLFIFTSISFADGLTGYEMDIDFEDSCSGCNLFVFSFYRVKF